MRTIILPIGPPGSGKSTLCNGLQQFLTAVARPVSVGNIDPANDNIPYNAAFDVRELVNVEEVMEREELGPNGGVLWAMEELEEGFDWLEEKLEACGSFEFLAGVVCVLMMSRGNDRSRSAWSTGTNDTSYGIAANTATTREVGLQGACQITGDDWFDAD